MSALQLPFWPELRKRLAPRKRMIVWLVKAVQTSSADMIRFQCNVCGKRTSFPRKSMTRDMWSCRHCASTVRMRSVIHALSNELFGKSLVIDDFPHRPDIVGIGLSDWEGYADRLSTKLGYTNTFFHKEPRLDITRIDPVRKNEFDFVISSDVFEHVCQPVSRAFNNASRLLKPGGVLILSVPYVNGGETKEHFPEVEQFSLQEREKSWFLVGKTLDGGTKEFTDLTFHGGPGTTVECRLFGEDSLRRDCENAGFEAPRIYHQEAEQFGILWIPYIAEKAPYRPFIYGLDTPPWALSKPTASQDENLR